MSDKADTSAPHFSERELQLLGFAMRSLKSGPPEIDYDKLAAFAGMSNPRSASNAWAGIKKKLMTADGAPGTPKAVAKATPKKKAVVKTKSESDSGDGQADGAEAPTTPTKTPRKRASKKQDVDGEESPKKRGRPGKPKKDAASEAVEMNVEPKIGDDFSTGADVQANNDASKENADDEI